MRLIWAAAVLCIFFHAGVAAAQDDLLTRSNLLGDLGGVRTSLSDHGLTLGIQDINEAFGNVSGGTRQGASYDGVTLFGVGLDTQKARLWDGGQFNIDAFDIRGRNEFHRRRRQCELALGPLDSCSGALDPLKQIVGQGNCG